MPLLIRAGQAAHIIPRRAVGSEKMVAPFPTRAALEAEPSTSGVSA